MKEDQQFKERFFAQYWWQDVGIFPNHNYRHRIDSQGIYMVDCIELTPLSAITDEHAIEVARIGGYPKQTPKIYDRDFEPPKDLMNDTTLLRGKKYVSGIMGVMMFGLSERSQPDPTRASVIIDFLRSKGYALPFGGKSVEQLIEMGILKLREI